MHAGTTPECAPYAVFNDPVTPVVPSACAPQTLIALHEMRPRLERHPTWSETSTSSGRADPKRKQKGPNRALFYTFYEFRGFSGDAGPLGVRGRGGLGAKKYFLQRR